MLRRDVVVVDGIVDEPVPAGVAVAEIGLAHEFSVRDIDEIVRNRHADLHALDFVAPLVLVRPPDARADSFAGGVDPGTASRIFAKREAAESACFEGIPGVVEIDRVDPAGVEGLREINEDGAEFALVLQLCRAKEDLVDVERLLEVELDARVVLEHLEADSVLPADEFLVGVDADIEMVEEQIVVGAIWAVRSA